MLLMTDLPRVGHQSTVFTRPDHSRKKTKRTGAAGGGLRDVLCSVGKILSRTPARDFQTHIPIRYPSIVDVMDHHRHIVILRYYMSMMIHDIAMDSLSMTWYREVPLKAPRGGTRESFKHMYVH